MAGFLEMLRQQLGSAAARDMASGAGLPASRAPLPSVPGTSVTEPTQGGMLAALQAAMLAPAPAAPAAEPAMAAPARAVVAAPKVAEASGAQQPGGITADDVKQFSRNFFGGAAAVDPTKPIGTAIAQGAAGALIGRQADERYKDKMALEEEDRKYKRDKLARDDARANSKEAREARLADSRQQEMAARTKKLNADAIKALDPNLTTSQKIDMERLIRDYGNQLAREDTLSDEERQTKMTQYRQSLEERLKPSSAAAPAAGGAPVKVNSPEEARKLPPGTKIILPDGRTGTVPGAR
jgi:hypothetical protein